MASHNNPPYPQASAPVPMPGPPQGPSRQTSYQNPHGSYDPHQTQPFPPYQSQPNSLPTIPSQQQLNMPMQGQPQPSPFYQQPSYGQPSYTPQSYTPQSYTPQSYTPQYAPQPQQMLHPGAANGYPFGEPNPQMMVRPAYDPRRASDTSVRSVRSHHSHHSRRSKYDSSDDDDERPHKHHHHHHHEDKHKEKRPTIGDSMYAAMGSVKDALMGK